MSNMDDYYKYTPAIRAGALILSSWGNTYPSGMPNWGLFTKYPSLPRPVWDKAEGQNDKKAKVLAVDKIDRTCYGALVIYPDGTVHVQQLNSATKYLGMELVVDVERPMLTRSGKSVANVALDGGRLKADVKIGDLTLRLSFELCGEFIPGTESPVDLVNT